MDMPTALHRALVRRLADGPRGLETDFDHMFTYGGIHNWATRPNETVPLDADTKNEVLEAVSSPMQWWAGQRLRHTSTYGIRIYRRGAMMLQHYDRRETHHVSAVLQVAQSGCDAGWPLEVLDARGGGVRGVPSARPDGALPRCPFQAWPPDAVPLRQLRQRLCPRCTPLRRGKGARVS